MGKPSKQTDRSLRHAFFHMGAAIRYSGQGLIAAVRLSLAFRQELVVFAVLCGLLALFHKPTGTWLLCLGVWSAVLVTELLNTAVEETLDLISGEYSTVIRDAKDMCSAAVFILLILNAATWIYIFWPDLLAALAGLS